MNNFYLLDLDHGLLQPSLDRRGWISEIVDNHIQEQFGHFKLVAEILH